MALHTCLCVFVFMHTYTCIRSIQCSAFLWCFSPLFLSQCMTIPIRFMWFKQTELGGKTLVSNSFCRDTSLQNGSMPAGNLFSSNSTALAEKSGCFRGCSTGCSPAGSGNAQSRAAPQGPVANFFLVGTGTIQVLL